MVNSHWRHDPFLQERIVQELNVPATPGNRRTMTVWELFTLQAEMTRAPYLFSCLGSMHCIETAVAGLRLPVLNLLLD